MKNNPSAKGVSRRHFLATTALAFSAPMIIPSSALGLGAKIAPSSRITMGMIGCGWQGGSNMGGFLQHANCQVVAVCDLDKNHLSGAVTTVNEHYKNQDCKPYHDYRELLARKDIDAVMIATPDHWHALTAVEAARQGKDIYGEKPLAKNIANYCQITSCVVGGRRFFATPLLESGGLPR